MHVGNNQESLADGDEEAFASFNKQIKTFVNSRGSEFKAAYDAAEAKSYAYPGEEFDVQDNFMDDMTYGKKIYYTKNKLK